MHGKRMHDESRGAVYTVVSDEEQSAVRGGYFVVQLENTVISSYQVGGSTSSKAFGRLYAEPEHG